MPYTIEKGTPRDIADIIDFGNYVFSHSGDMVDFPTLLPKLYGKNADTSACHYLAKENGKIKGMVGSFPMDLSIGDSSLKVSGIGTVCVHPYSRGSGYMKLLMSEALQDMKKNGTDLAILGGQRQRYQYFGFEQCGQALFFNVTSSNVRHALEGRGENCSFQPLEGEWLDDAYDLHNLQQVHMNREHDSFSGILRSWNSSPLAFIKDDVFAGYIVVSAKKDSIIELVLSDETLLYDLLAVYFQSYQPESVRIRMMPYEIRLNSLLSMICEMVEIKKSYSYQVFNFKKVLNAALNLKAVNGVLPEGQAVLEIKEYGKYLIRVSSGEAFVTETENTPETSLSYMEAMRALFAPVSFFCQDCRLPAFLKLLFPLPLYIPKCDMV